MNRILALAYAFLFASITVSSACLAASSDPAARLVSYNDLDLSSPSDVKMLHRRIESAIAVVCLDASGPSPAAILNNSCRAEALRSTRLQLRNAIQQQALRSQQSVPLAIRVSRAAPSLSSNH